MRRPCRQWSRSAKRTDTRDKSPIVLGLSPVSVSRPLHPEHGHWPKPIRLMAAASSNIGSMKIDERRALARLTHSDTIYLDRYMNLADMRSVVRTELAHIPDWPYPQRELRMAYWNMRMANLGRKRQVEGSALDIVRQCIGLLERHHPGHSFEYDEPYFRRIGSNGD